jgi:hypothetical protein
MKIRGTHFVLTKDHPVTIEGKSLWLLHKGDVIILAGFELSTQTESSPFHFMGEIVRIPNSVVAKLPEYLITENSNMTATEFLARKRKALGCTWGDSDPFLQWDMMIKNMEEYAQLRCNQLNPVKFGREEMMKGDWFDETCPPLSYHNDGVGGGM